MVRSPLGMFSLFAAMAPVLWLQMPLLVRTGSPWSVHWRHPVSSAGIQLALFPTPTPPSDWIIIGFVLAATNALPVLNLFAGFAMAVRSECSGACPAVMHSCNLSGMAAVNKVSRPSTALACFPPHLVVGYVGTHRPHPGYGAGCPTISG